MKALRIGILDEEEAYVERLAGYLNREKKGNWKISAFTDANVLGAYLEKRKLDILVGTDREQVEGVHEKYPDLGMVWLTEQEEAGKSKRDSGIFYPLYRYQSAKRIGEGIEEFAGQIRKQEDKTMIAVYSPIGRCGKTAFALSALEQNTYGGWLYIGMEDYSSLPALENAEGGAFLYYMKERNETKVMQWIEESGGRIPSAGSPFDTKQIEEEDIEWFRGILDRCGNCKGAIFDIGTGVLKDYELFLLFDVVVVPYLTGEKELAKKERFEQLLNLYGMEHLRDSFYFINMEKEEEVAAGKKELFDA